ncbi:cobyric acid synthase [Clostridium tertium]|jgi:adenosylcobyric acid synthase|uniref:cobyric acid synthase n=1 Tax=Clostridium tertium TaxID=1559 RepID=UPI001C1DD6A7|nr:cobyric acid synthase [Clostridium tertium]MBU6136132.1 cobyric acid synthase [Clostridium tertium]
MSRSIMLLGTASSVGKSTIATAFCRYFKNKGFNVAPFKALNISLNSYVTEEGLEMGRAQVVQADACEIKPKAWMNPILLKPSGNMKTQVIVNGKVQCTMDSYKYKELNRELKKIVKETFNNVSKSYDLMILEGSGSCAEINLKDTDIANMSMAKMSNSPVLLVADIDRGGVFAAVVGTIMLLDEEERQRVKGVIINKFRGNVEYFKPAMKQLEDIIKIPVLGAMPYFDLDIEDEDSVTERLKNKNINSGKLDVVVVRLPYMSNFTDFNSLGRLNQVSLRYVESASDIGNPNLLIIPGSKNTIEDLRAIKSNGIFNKIIELEKSGTLILGICGGYQMLGNIIKDDLGVEGDITSETGFGFLDICTSFNKTKVTKQSEGKVVLDKITPIKDVEVFGYEIHNGISNVNKNAIPFIKINSGEILGVTNKDYTVLGTYLHGIFDGGEFLNAFIKYLLELNNMEAIIEDITSYNEYKLKQFDELSKILEDNIDMKKLEEIIKI